MTTWAIACSEAITKRLLLCSEYAHMAVYIGNGKIFDSARGHTPQMQCGALGVDWWTKENGWVVKLAIRFTGK